MITPPRWSADRLATDLAVSIEGFRKERMQEPLDAYVEAFDRYLGNVEELLELTVDLTELEQTRMEIVTDPRLLEVFRYLAGPPISTDDLKTVAETGSLSRAKLRTDPALAARVVELVLLGLDRRRFPWVREGREPSEAERGAAALASAALMATQRVATDRRGLEKSTQEAAVRHALINGGLAMVKRRKMTTLVTAPAAGEFCNESDLGKHRADFVVRLWDQRVMPIECKVSNSAINSVKRLNREAASKAEAWRGDFGRTQIVPVAILSGVYKLHNLEDAQDRGLTLFWAHDLAEMFRFIEKTKAA